MRELRDEGGSSSIAREVWRLAKVEDAWPVPERAVRCGRAARSDSGSPDAGSAAAVPVARR